MDDDPREAVERAAEDAAWRAEMERELPAVSQGQTSVALPTDGAPGDPEAVGDRLSADLDTEVELNWDDADYLAMMEAELRRLSKHGLLEGIPYITDSPDRFDHGLKDRASGLYHTGTGELYVAPEEIVGEEPREREAREGYFSTDKNFGSVWHELGHHWMRMNNPNEEFSPREGESYWGEFDQMEFGARLLEEKGEWQDVDAWFDPATTDPSSAKEARTAANDLFQAEISDYAKNGPMEFAAEVFAGLMAGETYPAPVMDFYEDIGGYVPPQGARDPDTAYVPMVAPGGSSEAGRVTAAVAAQAARAAIVAERPPDAETGIGAMSIRDGDGTLVEQVAGRRVDRFARALVEKSGEWTDSTWMVDPFIDEMPKQNRVTLGILLFPEGGDINPSDFHFDIDSGRIIDALLRFPDVPGDSVGLGSDEHHERNDRVEAAIETTDVPEGIEITTIMAAGHVGRTPHVEFEETETVPPAEFADWVGEVRQALRDEFADDRGRYERGGYAYYDFSDEEDRREAFEKMAYEWGSSQLTEVVRLVVDEVAEDHFDAAPEDVMDAVTGPDGLVEPPTLAEYVDTNAAEGVHGVPRNVSVLIYTALRESYEKKRDAVQAMSPDGVPDRLLDVVGSWEPGFDIKDTGGPSAWTSQWSSEYDAHAGVSGLYFPEHGLMVLDNRQAAHHNQQWNAVTSRDDLLGGEEAPSPVMPFTMDYSTHTDGWRVEMARSHGGLYQALSRAGLADVVERLVSPSQVEPRYVWDVVYAARKAGIPGDGTIEFGFKDPGASVDPNYAPTYEVPLEAMYRELRFEGKLPEEAIDRGALAEQAATVPTPEEALEGETDADLYHVTRRMDGRSIALNGLEMWSKSPSLKEAEREGPIEDDPMMEDPADATATRMFTELLGEAQYEAEGVDDLPVHDDNQAVFFWQTPSRALKVSKNIGFSTSIVGVDSSKLPCECAEGDVHTSDAIWGGLYDQVQGRGYADQDELLDEAIEWWEEDVRAYDGGEDGDVEVWCGCDIPPAAIEWVYDTVRETIMFTPTEGPTLFDFEEEEVGAIHAQEYDPQPIDMEDLEGYDFSQVPARYSAVPELYAVADLAGSASDFRKSISSEGLMDISNREMHRLGRILDWDPDWPQMSVATLDEELLYDIELMDPPTAQAIREAKRTGTVTMYRAVPSGVDEIEPGDYVALNREYAETHAGSILEGHQERDAAILTREVPAEDVVWGEADASEFAYSPASIRETFGTVNEFYEAVNGGEVPQAQDFDVLVETTEDIHALLDEYGAMHVREFEGVDYYAVHENPDVWVVKVYGGGDAEAVPFNEWIYDTWTWDGLGEWLDYGVIETFKEDFWRSDTAYHATEPENAARIIESGSIGTRSETRGTGNRNVGSAVFLSKMSPQRIYGDVVFEVDVAAMRDTGYKPPVDMEPGVLEARQREAIATDFYVDDFWADYPQDVSEDTVILYDDVPLEYLSMDADDETFDEVASMLEDEDALEWVERQRDEEGAIYGQEPSDLALDIRDLTMGGHSYRNFDPRVFNGILDRIDALEDQAEEMEKRKQVAGAFPFIEGGRWDPFLESAWRFFSKLDTDERVLFTRRNPDIVQWIHVWCRANEVSAYPDYYEEAGDLLTWGYTRQRTGMAEREYDRVLPPDYQPPAFERHSEETGKALLKDMMHRRRSYRNWSPFEVMSVFGEYGETIELSRGELSELGWNEDILYTDDLYDVMGPDETWDVERRAVALQLIRRIEGGRFAEALDNMWTQFRALDADEAKLIGLRNPGFITWTGVYMRADGGIWDMDNMFDLSASMDWPLLGNDDVLAADAGGIRYITDHTSDGINETLRNIAENGDFGPVQVSTLPPGDTGPWIEPGVPKGIQPYTPGGQIAEVRMPVEDFKRLQEHIATEVTEQSETAADFWSYAPPDSEQVQEIVDVLSGETEPDFGLDGMPMPYVEVGRNGRLMSAQEGRHRVVAAERLGMDTIPVRIIYNGERTGVEAAASRGFKVVGDDPDPAAVRLARAMVDFGADRVALTAHPDQSTVDFELPLPGDDPIRSGVKIRDGDVVRATVRFGVLDQAAFGEHPTTSKSAAERLADTLRDTEVPAGAAVYANFGDTHYPPRPHAVMGWKADVPDLATATVQEGDHLAPVDVAAFIEFVKTATDAVHDEFLTEYVTPESSAAVYAKDTTHWGELVDERDIGDRTYRFRREVLKTDVVPKSPAYQWLAEHDILHERADTVRVNVTEVGNNLFGEEQETHVASNDYHLPTEGDAAWHQMMRVHRDLRRRGIASILTEMMKEDLRDLGYTTVYAQGTTDAGTGVLESTGFVRDTSLPGEGDWYYFDLTEYSAAAVYRQDAWQDFEYEDNQWIEVGDRVRVKRDGDIIEGEVSQKGMSAGLYGVETDDGEDIAVEDYQIVEYRPEGDDLDDTRRMLRDFFDNKGVGPHSTELADWTDDNQYREIQEHIRNVESTARESKYYDEHPEAETTNAILATVDEETAQTIEWAQGHAQTSLPEEITVYRGIKVDVEDYLDRAEAMMASDEPMSEPGFQSSSLSRETASSFGNVLLEIETDTGVYLRGASEFAGEDEVLLPAGASFDVLDVDREDRTVHVRLVDDGWAFSSYDADHLRDLVMDEGLSYGDAIDEVTAVVYGTDGSVQLEDDIQFESVTPEVFAERIEGIQERHPARGAFLTYHPPEDLTEHTLLHTPDHRAGIAIAPGGDLQNLFNFGGKAGAGQIAIQEGLYRGGCILDCYGEYLNSLYAYYGFVETGRMEFVAEYAPDGWDFDEYNHPDVVFMAYRPELVSRRGHIETQRYYDPSEWDKAKADSKEIANCGGSPVLPQQNPYLSAHQKGLTMDESTEDTERTQAEQRAINLVARRKGREYAEENAGLIIAQAKLVGDIPTDEP